MLSVLFKKEKLSSLFVWSFFSFALIRFSFLFIYIAQNNAMYFLLLALLYSLLSFLLYFVFRSRFRIRLTYVQYLVCNILSGILVIAFAYGYYLVAMLPVDRFEPVFYIKLLFSGLLGSSLLYSFTLIKRSAV